MPLLISSVLLIIGITLVGMACCKTCITIHLSNIIFIIDYDSNKYVLCSLTQVHKNCLILFSVSFLQLCRGLPLYFLLYKIIWISYGESDVRQWWWCGVSMYFEHLWACKRLQRVIIRGKLCIDLPSWAVETCARVFVCFRVDLPTKSFREHLQRQTRKWTILSIGFIFNVLSNTYDKKINCAMSGNKHSMFLGNMKRQNQEIYVELCGKKKDFRHVRTCS